MTDEIGLNDETTQENKRNEECSLVVNDVEEQVPEITDLEIIRKYCGNYVEKCNLTDGN